MCSNISSVISSSHSRRKIAEYWSIKSVKVSILYILWNLLNSFTELVFNPFVLFFYLVWFIDNQDSISSVKVFLLNSKIDCYWHMSHMEEKHLIFWRNITCNIWLLEFILPVSIISGYFKICSHKSTSRDFSSIVCKASLYLKILCFLMINLYLFCAYFSLKGLKVE